MDSEEFMKRVRALGERADGVSQRLEKLTGTPGAKPKAAKGAKPKPAKKKQAAAKRAPAKAKPKPKGGA